MTQTLGPAEIAHVLLEGEEPEDALPLLAAHAQHDLAADGVVLVLPNLDDTFVVEVAHGSASHLVGTVMPHQGRSVGTTHSQRPLAVTDLSTEPDLRVPELRDFGPALYVPLGSLAEPLGAMLVLRHVGAPAFSEADARVGLALGTQATLALALAEARHRSLRDELAEQRAEIARDLHDFVIQELFATGAALQRVRRSARVGEQVRLEDVDLVESCLQAGVDAVRAAIATLREPTLESALETRLSRECTRARTQLGFAPGLDVAADVAVTPLDGRLADDLAAIVREALSNAARHADASRVQVSVWFDGPLLRMTISDNGRGIPVEPGRRSGLSTMDERARRHGGSAVVHPIRGAEGTMVEVEVRPA